LKLFIFGNSNVGMIGLSKTLLFGTCPNHPD
jgi:hypothetical protein